jgi:Tfp pilus assembly protein PilV
MSAVKMNEKGIGLVETVLALGVAVAVITSLVSLTLYTLRSSQQSKYMLQATKLANEELERVRAKRDSGSWTVFMSSLKSSETNINCELNPCSISPTYVVTQAVEQIPIPGLTQTISRSFTIDDPIDGSIAGTETMIRVTVTVGWPLGGTTKYVYTSTDLSNWRGN